MKIQYLAVIFIIIIMPIVIIFSEYINNQITTIKTENTYDARLLDSTYDAIKAYQLNTINNVNSEKPEFKKSDIEAAATTFLNSISTSFEYTGYKSDVIKEYVPAIVYTMYDGYYVYSPFVNTLTGVNNDDVDEEFSNNTTLHGLKPFVYYSCRYKVGAKTDFTIVYTLDNYISIEGQIDGKYVYDGGYLIDLNSTTLNGSEITYNGVTMSATKDTEAMWEYIGNKKFYYARIDGDKFYYNGDATNGVYKNTKKTDTIFSITNNGDLHTQCKNDTKEHRAVFERYYEAIFKNKKGFLYYRDSYQFTKKALSSVDAGGYGLKDLTVGNAVDKNGNFVTQDEFDSDLNFKIFDGTVPIEESNSNFNKHRADVIKRVIKTNLATSISGFNRYSNLDSNVDFIMPKISDTDWNQIQNNVCIITFLQGMPIGGKVYNGYAVVPNNMNKEYVDENDIYVLKSDNTYAKANENNLTLKSKNSLGYYPGILKINFERKKNVITGQTQSGYYYPIGINPTTPYYGSYKSIVGSSGANSIEYEDMYKYMKELNNNEVKKAYYIALGRERLSMYNVNNGLFADEKDVKIHEEGVEDPIPLENGFYFKSDIALTNVTLNRYVFDFDYNDQTKEYKPIETVKDGSIVLTRGVDYEVSYEDNNKVGTAKVVITGIGLYTGTKTVSFKIRGSENASDYVITLNPNTFTYNGKEHKPSVTLKFKGTNVPADDYTVLYGENVNAGTAVAYVSGTGNYPFNGSKDFTINPKRIDSPDISITLDAEDYVYDGTDKRPIPIVKDNAMVAGRKILTEDKDYYLQYNINPNVGIGIIRVIGKGNYTSVKEIPFSIKALDATGKLTIILSQTTFVYDGTPKKPIVSVLYNKNDEERILLEEGKDYRVAYLNNIEPGTATVRITGIGNYEGTTGTETFVITSKDAEGLDVKLTPTSYIYDGTAKKPSVKVYDEGKLVSADNYDIQYVDNIEVGQGKVIVKGKGLYNNKNVIAIFSIFAKPINADWVTFNPTSMQYTGKELEPGVIVKEGEKTLKKNVDYVVTYENNINTDKGTAIVRGINNYSGKVEKTFVITPKPIKKAWIKFDKSSYSYTASEIKPIITIKDADRNVNLVEKTDYTISYSNNINTGENAKVTVKGKGNYTGTVEVTFKITKASLSDAEVILPEEGEGAGPEFAYEQTLLIYDGTPKKPKFMVMIGDNIISDNDYTVRYENNINATTETSKAVIIIEGKGVNCTGTVRKKFDIKPKNITDPNVTITLNPANLDTYQYTFNWDDKIPEIKEISVKFKRYSGEYGDVTVTEEKVDLKLNTDYEFSCTGNRYPNTDGEFSIWGIGNYTGKIEKPINIKPKNISETTITVANQTYDGKEKKPLPTIKDGTHTLQKDVHYTIVSYSNNTNAGTNAKIKIQGKGYFTGTVEVKFSIINPIKTASGTEKALEGAVVSGANFTYKAELTYNLSENTTTNAVTGSCTLTGSKTGGTASKPQACVAFTITVGNQSSSISNNKFLVNADWWTVPTGSSFGSATEDKITWSCVKDTISGNSINTVFDGKIEFK